MLKISSAQWILHGARAEPHTLTVIRDFIRQQVAQGQGEASGNHKANTEYQGARAVVFLDELDKLTSRSGMADAWYRSATGEVISLADGDSRLEASGWTKADLATLKSVMVIGAGSFLDGLEPGGDQDKTTHLEAIASHCALPDEVRLRFNSKLVYIESPTEHDYRDAFSRVYDDLGLPLPSPGKLNDLVVAAQEAKAGLRTVEQHIGELLIAHPHLRRRPSPVPETAVAVPEKTEKSSLRVVPRAKYDRYTDELHLQMKELEAPLAHVQALFDLHEAQFVTVRGDTIHPATNQAISAMELHADFSSVLRGLQYVYCIDDQERTKASEELWVAGHRVLTALSNAIVLEADFLNEELHLALFTQVYTRLSRLLRAIHHFSSLRAEGGE